jgi:hypothetical protein
MSHDNKLNETQTNDPYRNNNNNVIDLADIIIIKLLGMSFHRVSQCSSSRRHFKRPTHRILPGWSEIDLAEDSGSNFRCSDQPRSVSPKNKTF